MNDHDMALEALRKVSPTRADDYHDWIRIGMALKKAGVPCETWDQWSRSSSKYHTGACEKKWRTFDSERGFGTVSVGTLVHMAEEDGAIMRQKRYAGPVVELDWDSSIGGGTVAEAPPPLLVPPDNWKKGLADFLEALFKPSEIVAYERAHFRGGAATEIGVGLQTRAQEVAAELKIETFPVTTTQVKKRATGKGNASKDEVMAEAQKIIGRWPQTDDEADAVFIGLVAVEELEVEADCGKEPDFS